MIYKRLHTHLKSFLTIPVRSFSQSYDDHKEARHLVNHRDAFKFHFNRFQKRHDSVSVNQHLGDVLGMRQGFRTSDSQYNQWRDLVLNKQTQLDDKKFAQALNNLLMFGIVDAKLWQFWQNRQRLDSGI